MRKIVGWFGRGLRNGFVAIGALAFAGSVIAIADYNLTQGSGTGFASVVISTKHYVAQLLCDPVVGETQCSAVKAASTAPLATDPALVVALSPNGAAQTIPTGASTSANQTNASQKSQIVDGSGNVIASTSNALNVNVNNANANGAAAPASSSPVTDANQPVGTAAFATTQVSVTSSATSILSARTGVSGTGRVSATITNTTTTAVYIGGSGVTTATGTLLPGIVGASITINTTAAIYGIVASTSATVTVIESY
jgi:hypothetical protein